MMDKILKTIFLGEILLEELMIPLGISQNQLARNLDVPPTRINDIIHVNVALLQMQHYAFLSILKQHQNFG